MHSALRRSMRFSHATAMVVGIILGASVFIQSSEITRLVPSTAAVMLAWLAAGALTFCGALVCAELTSAFPQTGGVYVFLRQIFSPALGFLWGWAMFWSIHSGIIAAIAVILARYVAYFVPMGEPAIRAVAIAAILLMVALFFSLGGAAHRTLPVEAPVEHISVGAYGLAVAAGLFAFGGWHMVTYAAGETHDPERTIPRALLVGTLIVTACYMLLNAGYHYVLPLDEVARSRYVAADAMQRILGAGAGGAIATLVVISAVGSLNGIILAGPRVYYAMAEDGLAFRWMGAVHPRRQTPYLAIAAQAVWSSVLVAITSYRKLFTRVVYTEWLFFALLAAGLFLLRRSPDYKPRFLTRGYP